MIMNDTIRVFFISDSTGITAQTLGNSVLSQFEGCDFDSTVLPYIDTLGKAEEAVERINQSFEATGKQPIVFDTVVNPEIHEVISKANALNFDVLNNYIKPIEETLNIQSGYTVGKAHGIAQDSHYKSRIDAVHFALENDDGGKIHNYDKADIILIGVSRCGKTPTCLYLALQFGIYAANYPITDDDLGELRLPQALKAHKSKLFGLTIDAERLALIRNERKAGSRYASMKQCEYEINEVEALFRQNRIPFLQTTDSSVEEIASKILSEAGIERT